MPPKRYIAPHERYIAEVNQEIFEKFGPQVPKANLHMVFSGPTDIGKSTALKAFISTFYQGVYDRIIVFNPSVRTEGYELLGVPEEDLIDDVSLPRIEKTFQEVFKEFDESGYRKSTMIIFDDFGKIFKQGYRTTKYNIYKDLIVARKKFCSCVFICQDAKQLPADVMQQIYSVSISPTFSETDSLRRQLEGFPGMELIRRKTTKPDKLTAKEAHDAVDELNKLNDDPYGRLFYYLKYPFFMYQQTIVEEEEEEIDGEKQIVVKYRTELTDIKADPDSEEELEEEIKTPQPKRKSRT